jgi:hypothetical protein
VPAATDGTPFADWLEGHAISLGHLEQAAPLDDLEPLRDILDGARVIALGEHSHFIREFAAMRQRLLRFLVERCGFTVLAFEYGFAEAIPIEAAFTRTGFGFADLRPARAANLSTPDHIRMQAIHQHTPVIDAFDGILCTPTSTTDPEKP